jgi:predicted CoA-substrate-specific enzyme activase
MKAFLGIDVGSVSTNLVLLNGKKEVIDYEYLRTKGEPIKAVQEGMRNFSKRIPPNLEVKGVGTTGSARFLTGVIVGADVIKNEITAHAIAASHVVPEVKTVLEIGGQDSKIIFLRHKAVVDFAMNTVCAAGTGSFLDHQAARLGIPIEEFGEIALKAKSGVQIAGRCTVFAESDMIHKQQMGYPIEEILYGLCEALVRNYLNNLAKGKEILPPVVFQGGVAANKGIKRAFEETLGFEVVVPKFHHVMGAIGAALLAQNWYEQEKKETSFKGFEISEINYVTSGFFCDDCSNNCEVVEVKVGEDVLARWGSRCGKWEVSEVEEVSAYSLIS